LRGPAFARLHPTTPVFGWLRGLPLLGTALFLACGATSAPPGVLLITVDTLRADHLSAYGAEQVRTPNLERLARDATLFERAATPMPLTRPTHLSLLTSLYPREHGVVNNALSLPESTTTLAEILRAQGYRTGAFVGVSLLSEEAGFGRGFETYRYPTHSKWRPADEVVPDAVRWLAGLGADDSFFLWVHLFEPHLPYEPPAAYRRDLDPALAAELPEVSWPTLKEIAREHGGDIPKPVLGHAKLLYRGEVEYTDYWVGRLLDQVDAARGLDRTLVVFTADHGECFENGVYFEHSDCLQEGAIRVPMIVRYPPAFARGARSETPVSSVDVPPTVLRALGLDIPPAYSGRPMQELEPDEQRYVLVQYPLYQPQAAEGRTRKQWMIRSVGGEPVAPILLDSQKVGVVGREWKYLRGDNSQELYALSPPDDARDLSAERPDVRAALAAELERQLSAHPLNVIEPGEINEELRETLRALGYLADAGQAAPPSGGGELAESELDRLRALGYVDVVEGAEGQPTGLVARDAERSQPGLTYFSNAHGCSSQLISADGRLLRSWSMQPCFRWDNTILLPSGEVLAAHRAPAASKDAPPPRAVLKFSFDGALQWRLPIPVHHDLEVTRRGQIAVMTHRHRLIPEIDPRVLVRDHFIHLLAPDGAQQEEVSLTEVLQSDPSLFHFQTIRPKRREGKLEIDLLHSNSVEFMRRSHLAGQSPLYGEGNVLVSLRHQDTVMIFHWETRRLLWAWGQGEIIGPHDATLLENGNVLLFDNRLGERWSRVIEVDPRSNRIVWDYRDPVPENFYSATRGAAQRLENGNTLITDSAHARIFEVTREGEIVWEFRNPNRSAEGERIAIVRARRVGEPRDAEARFAWSD
jgi:arylsulfatase A-like enzyme